MREPEGLPVPLGVVVGATAGGLIGLAGGDRGSQLGWAMASGVGLAHYLTLVGLALATGRSAPRAIVAALVSAPIVLLVLASWTLAVTVALFGVGMAVPVAAVLAAIFLLAPLSFMRTWPGEVIAAVTMPFVVVWWMLLERAAGRLQRRQTRQSHQVEATPPRRIGHAVMAILGTVLAAVLGAVLDRAGDAVDRLRNAEGPVGRWVVVPRQTMPFVACFLAAGFLFAALVLVDWLVFGGDYAASHQQNVAAATIGAAVGGLYGACVGVVSTIAAGTDAS